MNISIGHTIYVKNSAEAVQLYMRAFGLSLGYHVQNEDGSFFHSELCKNDHEILSVVEAPQDQDQPSNNIVCLGITLPDFESVHSAFAILAEGGRVKTSITSLPWSPCCAEIIDRFGVWWYITAPQHRPDDDFDPKTYK